ncbi:MAG: hypothetical protein ACRC4N_13965, partial [Gammaproteobacteria bacterium]
VSHRNQLLVCDGEKTLLGLTFHPEIPVLNAFPRKLQRKVDCSRASNSVNTECIERSRVELSERFYSTFCHRPHHLSLFSLAAAFNISMNPFKEFIDV